MKKTAFTIAFVALVSFAAQSQTAEPAKKGHEQTKKEAVNPDGTKEHHANKAHENVPEGEKGGHMKSNNAAPSDKASEKGKEHSGKAKKEGENH